MSMSEMWTAETLAEFFHSTYESLAPNYGYETRESTRVQWKDVPDQNKALMVAVAGQVLDAMAEDGLFNAPGKLMETEPPPTVVVNNITNEVTIDADQLDQLAKRMTSEFWARLRS